jgi:hypothetical protein
VQMLMSYPGAQLNDRPRTTNNLKRAF